MSDRDAGVARGTKVFVGNLHEDTRKDDLEKFFKGTGPLVSVWVARSPPGFAFIEFEDPRDARDACDDLDGRELLGRQIRVELAHGRGRGGPRGGPPPRRYDDRDRYDDRRGGYDDRRGGYDDRDRYDDRRGGYDDRDRYDDRRGGYGGGGYRSRSPDRGYDDRRY